MLTSGPTTARVVIVTDFPSSLDINKRSPLSDYAGSLFFEVAAKAGFNRSNVFILSLWDTLVDDPSEEVKKLISDRKTCPGANWEKHGDNWIHPSLLDARDQAQAILKKVNPTIVITLGEISMWALTGNTKHGAWRGSRLSPPDAPWQVVPTLHPRTMIVDPAQKHIFLIDLKRSKAIFEGKQQPRAYKFTIAPTCKQVLYTLELLRGEADRRHKAEERPLRLSGDTETRAGHITCMGIAWSPTEAICIPLITTDDEKPFFFTEEEEALIIHAIAKLFLHPHIEWVGQNFLYDCQYFYRHWGVVPRQVKDTMIGHHACFANMRKGLGFLSAMYAQDHVYWKDEIDGWDPLLGERQYWEYNCKDCCITLECWEEIEIQIIDLQLAEHACFQQELFFPVLRMMNRGIRINEDLKGKLIGFDLAAETEKWSGLKGELIAAANERQSRLEYLVGHPLNPKSPAQLSKFFYNDLGIPGVKNLAGDALTTNSPAMATIAEREPLLKPVCQLIVELRSIGVFLSTFIDAKLDADERMRCSFSIAGPITYRFSSSENAFGSGMNLQNIPVAEKAKIKDKDYIKLPNIRKLFIPDPGYTFFDMDLDRADLQVVVWEADDKDMKYALRENLDMHCVNAVDIFGINGIPLDELKETHPNYKEHRGRIGEASRNKAKVGVHATNYGVGDNKLSQALGITRAEASSFRARWFAAHPGIKRWHTRTEQMVIKRGFIENKFGARLYNLGRLNLPELLGWLPQSTVAGVINRALVNIDEEAEAGKTSIQLLIQVHDSLAGQFLTGKMGEEVETLRRLARIEIPYDEPLIIPVGINCSEKSWGDCK